MVRSAAETVAEPSGPAAALWQRALTLIPCLVVVSAALLWQAPLAEAGQSATVDAEAEEGYGRLVLTFSERVPDYTVRASQSVAVIIFRQPIAAEVVDIAPGLPDYVTAARLDPDGGALRLALAMPVSLNTMKAGEKLFIDLLPEGWVGMAPGLPQEVVDALTRRAEMAQRQIEEARRQDELERARPVELRIAQLPTLTRFAFIWETPVEADIASDAGRARIAFDAFGHLETAGRLVELPDYISGLDTRQGENGLEVVLDLDAEAGIRGFSEESSYIVDVTAPAAGEAPDKLASLATEAAFSDAMEAAQEVDASGSGLRTADSQITAETRPLRAAGEPEGQGATDRSSVRASEAGRAPEEFLGQAGGPVRAEARRFGSAIRLTFPFREPTASAIFERAGALWLVFDTTETIDIGAIRADLRGSIKGVDLLAASDHAVIRLDFDRALLMSVSGEATDWVVTIGETLLEAPAPVDLVRRTGAAGQSEVAVPLPGIRSVHRKRDPETGDTLFIATAMPPARAMLKRQELVDFAVLASAHGVAVQRRSDDLKAQIEDDELILSRKGGLRLSAMAGGSGAATTDALTGNSVRPGFVDIETESIDPTAVYELITSRLRAVAESDGEMRATARLKLGRAMLATNLAAEALAQFDTIAQEHPEMMREPSLRALRGVALVLMHRPRAALEELDSHGLSGSSDVALWRSLAEMQRGNWRAALAALDFGEPALASYSKDRQRLFGMAGARAAIEVQDPTGAIRWLSGLDGLAHADDPELLVLKGRLAEAEGETAWALQIYNEVIETEAGKPRAEALLRSLALRHASGAIDPDAAIEELERLALFWRGDEIELETLRRLAGLHAAQGSYRRAFDLMKTATHIEPASPITRALQDEMKIAFETLFLGGDHSAMEPVDALALYYDFRELTPIGAKGDEMIRVLADRLVEVDLLDSAAELLTHQVDNRLHGAARAQVAARLASVHLMNRKPAKALNVLARTRQVDLPEAVLSERHLLEVRALSEAGRYELALDRLTGIEGDGSERLRADTLWRAERWQDAAESYERVLGESWSTAEGLDDQGRHDVLRSAISYALAEDQLGLQRLRAKFLQKMSAGPDGHAFDLVTSAFEESADTLRDLVRNVAATDSLDAFMQEYRHRYRPQARSGSDAAQPG